MGEPFVANQDSRLGSIAVKLAIVAAGWVIRSQGHESCYVALLPPKEAVMSRDAPTNSEPLLRGAQRPRRDTVRGFALNIVTPRWCIAVACALTSFVNAARADDIEEICSGVRLPFESPPFERLDRNGDDRLTADEATECHALEAVYSRLDLDADGALTRPEYSSFADVWRRRARTFGTDAR